MVKSKKTLRDIGGVLSISSGDRYYYNGIIRVVIGIDHPPRRKFLGFVLSKNHEHPIVKIGNVEEPYIPPSQNMWIIITKILEKC